MDGRKQIENGIRDYFINKDNSLIITRRILNVLTKKILESEDITIDNLSDFLEKEQVIDFVSGRQPFVRAVDDNTVKNIENYFKKSEGLKEYQILLVYRASNHPEDDYLYSVVGYKNSLYSCWSSWNDKTKSLNHGHYGLTSLEVAKCILKENFYDITDQTDMYGIKQSEKVVSTINNIIDFKPGYAR